jgi:hypothetical protein
MAWCSLTRMSKNCSIKGFDNHICSSEKYHQDCSHERQKLTIFSKAMFSHYYYYR